MRGTAKTALIPDEPSGLTLPRRLSKLPKRAHEPEPVENRLVLGTSARSPVGVEACAPPRVSEVAEFLRRNRGSRLPRAEPSVDVFFRPEEIH